MLGDGCPDDIREKYQDIFAGVLPALWEKRRKDCVDKWALAAAMVNPRNVYTPHEPYNPDGGVVAIGAAINKFYRGDAGAIAGAMLTWQHFRERSGIFFGEETATVTATSKSSGEFWTLATIMLSAGGAPSEGCDLFRKLVCGYGGQGEAERLNKKVKQFRSIERNKQAHHTTEALLTLHSYYENVNRQQPAEEKVLFLDFVRDKIITAQLREEAEAAEAVEQAALVAMEDEEVGVEVGIDDNNNYGSDNESDDENHVAAVAAADPVEQELVLRLRRVPAASDEHD